MIIAVTEVVSVFGLATELAVEGITAAAPECLICLFGDHDSESIDCHKVGRTGKLIGRKTKRRTGDENEWI